MKLTGTYNTFCSLDMLYFSKVYEPFVFFSRLLDMGFEKEVSSILQAVKDQLSPNNAFQTVLMSATLNKGNVLYGNILLNMIIAIMKLYDL